MHSFSSVYRSMRPFPRESRATTSGRHTTRRGRREIATILHNNFSRPQRSIAYLKGPLHRSYQKDYQQRRSTNQEGDPIVKMSQYSGQNARLAYLGGRVAMTDKISEVGLLWAPTKRANGAYIQAVLHHPIQTLSNNGTCSYPEIDTTNPNTIPTVGNADLRGACWPTAACNSASAPARGYVPPEADRNCLQQRGYPWKNQNFLWFRLPSPGSKTPIIPAGNFHLCNIITEEHCPPSEEEEEAGIDVEPTPEEGSGGDTQEGVIGDS